MAPAVPFSEERSAAHRPDPFEALGIAPTFDLDMQALRAAWMRRALVAHPDASFGSSPEDTNADASRLNDAYQILRQPLLRAEALLIRLGALAEHEAALPSVTLLEVMELRERADDAQGDPLRLHELRNEVVHERTAALARISAAFAKHPDALVAMTPHLAHEIRVQMNVTRAFDRVLEQLDRERGASEP